MGTNNHSISTKQKNLRTKLLPRMGVDWPGSDVEFTELLPQLIDQMPQAIREPMHRFYIDGGTQYKNDETGIPLPEDSTFYQKVTAGRYILGTWITTATNRPELLQKIQDICS